MEKTIKIFKKENCQIIKLITSAGALIHLIAGKRVIIYKVKDGVISYNNENTLEGLFKITENKIKAAFNNKKVECIGNPDSNCIKTTLVVDTGTEDSKYYEVNWKKRVCLFKV